MHAERRRHDTEACIHCSYCMAYRSVVGCRRYRCTNQPSLSFPTLCPVRSCGCVALQLRPGTHSLDDEKGHLYEDTPDLSARLVSEGQLFAPPAPRQQSWRHIRRMVPCAGWWWCAHARAYTMMYIWRARTSTSAFQGKVSGCWSCAHAHAYMMKRVRAPPAHSKRKEKTN